MEESSADREAALEEIAYLARSANRVRILEALAEEPHPRRALEEATGTSRTTLGRILNELEERGWAHRAADGDYVATPAGRHVANEFGPLVEAMAAIRGLDEAVAVLPTDALSIGLENFRDATVRRPDPNVPMAINRYLAGLLREASSFHTLTFFAPAVVVGEVMYEGVTAGRLTATHVLAGGLVGHLQEDSEGPPPWGEYVAAGARVYRYDGHIPCNLFVVDETVLVQNSQAGLDRPETFVESRNETVRTWAVGLVETYRGESEGVDAESFP